MISPTKSDFEHLLVYRAEFEECGSHLDGTADLASFARVEDWFAAMTQGMDEATVRPGRVAASTYLAVREGDGHLVGMVNIRYRLNDFLLHLGGHIGYSVRPSERRKGYAKTMLRLALDACRSMGLKRVLLTCDRDNIASAKTIRANGGVLENEVPEGRRTTQRYWIVL